jgi:GT2 family glycosyltransferase
MKGPTSVGVVIVTYNSADIIAPCLESLRRATSHPIHTVVVDNNSTDGTLDAIALNAPQATLIRNHENLYYAAASNQGLRTVTGGHILLLNPDTVLPIGGIDALFEVLSSRPEAGAVAPMLVHPDGMRQSSLREFPGLDTLWYDLLGLSFLFPKSRTFGRWRMGYFDGLSARPVDQPMASCLLVKRAVFEKVGMFDEAYPMFFNDVDWCKRASDAGFSVWYTPEVKVGHLGGATVKKYRSKMIWMSHQAYFLYLRRLYAGNPLKTTLTFLSGPPLFFAAFLRSVWHALRG